MSKQKNLRKVIFLVLVIVLVLVMIFSGLQVLESTVLFGGQDNSDEISSKTVIKNGIEYYLTSCDLINNNLVLIKDGDNDE